MELPLPDRTYAASRSESGALGAMELPLAVIRPLVERALAEDVGRGDVTSDALLPTFGVPATAHMVARAPGVVVGVGVAAEAFQVLDPAIAMERAASDGVPVQPGQPLLRVRGSARAILAAERVALNFVQRLSGIATLTARYVAAVEGTSARIVDTRKTTPGLRALERHAVRCGGGVNHRYSLGDAVLVKDNHRAALRAAGIPLAGALARARSALGPMMRIEVEVDDLDELDEALAGQPDAVLLDNMSPPDLAEAVGRIAGRAMVEASGGITLDTVRAIADAGVDLISVGALTHSAPALDVALEFQAGQGS